MSDAAQTAGRRMGAPHLVIRWNRSHDKGCSDGIMGSGNFGAWMDVVWMMICDGPAANLQAY